MKTLFGWAIVAFLLWAAVAAFTGSKTRAAETPAYTYVPPVASAAPAPVVQPDLTCETWYACQQYLLAAGYDLGPSGADGVYGPKTQAAWNKCYKDGRCRGEAPKVQQAPVYYQQDDDGVPGWQVLGYDSLEESLGDGRLGDGPFIPYAGNGLGPTPCADGTWSHSAGSGTCSWHGGIR